MHQLMSGSSLKDYAVTLQATKESIFQNTEFGILASMSKNNLK